MHADIESPQPGNFRRRILPALMISSCMCTQGPASYPRGFAAYEGPPQGYRPTRQYAAYSPPSPGRHSMPRGFVRALSAGTPRAQWLETYGPPAAEPYPVSSYSPSRGSTFREIGVRTRGETQWRPPAGPVLFTQRGPPYPRSPGPYQPPRPGSMGPCAHSPAQYPMPFAGSMGPYSSYPAPTSLPPGRLADSAFLQMIRAACAHTAQGCFGA